MGTPPPTSSQGKKRLLEPPSTACINAPSKCCLYKRSPRWKDSWNLIQQPILQIRKLSSRARKVSKWSTGQGRRARPPAPILLSFFSTVSSDHNRGTVTCFPISSCLQTPFVLSPLQLCSRSSRSWVGAVVKGSRPQTGPCLPPNILFPLPRHCPPTRAAWPTHLRPPLLFEPGPGPVRLARHNNSHH